MKKATTTKQYTIIVNHLEEMQQYALKKSGCTLKEVEILEIHEPGGERSPVKRQVITLPQGTRMVVGIMKPQYSTYWEGGRAYPEYDGSSQEDYYLLPGKVEIQHVHGEYACDGDHTPQRTLIIPLSWRQQYWNDTKLLNNDPTWQQDLYYLGNVPVFELPHFCDDYCMEFGCSNEHPF